MDRDDFDSRVGAHIESPPRLEGEQVLGHAASAGKKARRRSPKRADSASVANRPRADVGADTGVEIVRATCRLAIIPSSLAEDPDAHKARECGGKESCGACKLIDALYNTQRIVARAKNLVTRDYWAADGAALDDFRLENARDPKSKEWPMHEHNAYGDIRRAFPKLASGIAAQVAREMRTKWRQDRFDALIRCAKSPPHYRDTGPIPVRKQDIAFACTGKNAYAVKLSLRSGRHEGGREFSIEIRARDAHQRKLLSELADKDGTVRHADVKIDRDRKNRWNLRMGYTRRVPLRVTGGAAALNRGIRAFLVARSDDDKTWIYDGNDIEAYLTKINARRRRVQNDSIASGRDGHGRGRMLAPLDALEEKGENWRKTKCQTIARRFSRWLADKGIQRLYVEDFTGIRHAPEELLDGGKFVWDRIQTWPYFQLQTRIVSCCEEEGIAVFQVSARKISTTCPSCGNDAKPDRRRWKLACESCGYRRHLDVAAATNVLTRGEEMREKEPKKLKRLSQK